MLKLKLQYFGHLMQKVDLEKTLKLKDCEKDCGKGEPEDEMIGWHHQLDGHEFGQTLRDKEEQRSLECCTPWDSQELDMT